MLSLSVAEFCHAVGISRRTFWNLLKQGAAPPVVRIGRRVVIRIEAAERWLQSLEQCPAPIRALRPERTPYGDSSERGLKPDAEAERVQRDHTPKAEEGEIVQITARIPNKLHNRLRRRVFDTRESINSMILRGLELVLGVTPTLSAPKRAAEGPQ